MLMSYHIISLEHFILVSTSIQSNELAKKNLHTNFVMKKKKYRNEKKSIQKIRYTIHDFFSTFDLEIKMSLGFHTHTHKVYERHIVEAKITSRFILVYFKEKIFAMKNKFAR